MSGSPSLSAKPSGSRGVGTSKLSYWESADGWVGTCRPHTISQHPQALGLEHVVRRWRVSDSTGGWPICKSCWQSYPITKPRVSSESLESKKWLGLGFSNTDHISKWSMYLTQLGTITDLQPKPRDHKFIHEWKQKEKKKKPFHYFFSRETNYLRPL